MKYDRYDLMFSLNRLVCRLIGHTDGEVCDRCCKPEETK